MTTETKDIITKNLSCELTEDEKNSKARALAAKLEEIARETERAAEVKQSLKTAMGVLTAEAGLLQRQVTTGFETRAITCHVDWDYQTGVIRTIRQDTDKEVGSRPMTDGERQQEFGEVTSDKAKQARKIAQQILDAVGGDAKKAQRVLDAFNKHGKEAAAVLLHQLGVEAVQETLAAITPKPAGEDW